MRTSNLQPLNCERPPEQQAKARRNEVERAPSTTPDSTISPRTPTSSVMLTDMHDDLGAYASSAKNTVPTSDAVLSKEIQYTGDFGDRTKAITIADELGQTRQSTAAKRSIQVHRTDDDQRLSLTADDTYTLEIFQMHKDETEYRGSRMNLPSICEQPPSSPSTSIENHSKQLLHAESDPTAIPMHYSGSRDSIHVPTTAAAAAWSYESLALPFEQPCRIPLVHMKRLSKKRREVIKKGPLLCAMKMSWYRSEQNLTGELTSNVSLRQNRPRWREFEAMLFYNRLELYAITDVFFRPRVLVHVIYLLPGKKHHVNTVRLTLTSSVDYTWQLQFRIAEEARLLSFMFSARTISESQEWYMALYRLSTAKLPVPPSIDLCLPTLNNVRIRIPVGSDIVAKNNNIRLADVKDSILRMLDQQKLRPADWFEDRIGLCWRTMSNPPRLEWIMDPSATFLVGPQIIEQTHQLEMRPYKRPEHDELPSPIMEGDLVIWTFPKKDPFGKPPKVRRQVHLIIDGSLLILVDIFRAEKPQRTEDPISDSRARLTSAGFSRYSKLSFRSNAGGVVVRSVARLFRNNSGSPSEAFKNEEDARALLEAELSRQAKNLNAAFAVMDLAQATMVRPAREDTYGTVKAGPELRRRSFELHMNDQVLLFETESIQIAFDWIMRIRRAIQACQQNSAPDLEKEARLGYRLQRAEWERSILQFGHLYVRNNRQKTFRHRFCVLTVNKRLIIFKTWQRKYWTNEAMSSMMYNYHKTLPLDAAYVYSDEAGYDLQRTRKEPPKMFPDGTICNSGDDNGPGNNTFVIWRPRILHPFFKPFSALKIGHRTGRKGTLWTFLARGRQEKETWLWALHQEIDTIDSA